ncbi:MAG: hypothetical protein GY941_12145 [Planctomycetes bacterium]|nr:hypothetical protein [Planctomycetota bacterium]
MDREVLIIELDTSLSTAAKALRHAWRLMKCNDMESTAKEIADTVLDVETAARYARRQLKEIDQPINKGE